MRDPVPSVRDQGIPVRFLECEHRAFNGAIFPRGKEVFIASRYFNPRTREYDIAVYMVSKHRNDVALRAELTLPRVSGRSHREDPRVLEHDGELHLSYVEVETSESGVVQRSTQRLVVLTDDFEFVREIKLPYRQNGIRGQEKNWMFFSHDGALHFVYSMNPHVVVRVADGQFRELSAGAGTPRLHWPHGTLSGGTPPVRVDDRYVAFFHSYVTTPKRQRRYSMSAYTFRAEPPFELLEITDPPLLTASANDPSIANPITPTWDPLVVFPCGAFVRGGVWTVSLGVNDSYNAAATLPHKELLRRLVPAGRFSQPVIRAFVTNNAASRPALGRRAHVVWEPYGASVGGVRRGKLRTSDPNQAAVLLSLEGVMEISPEDYAQLQ